MFENVTYSFYTETLGRSAVPESAFDLLADDNKMFMKQLVVDGIVKEREENGIDIAVCRMIEVFPQPLSPLRNKQSLQGSERNNKT